MKKFTHHEVGRSRTVFALGWGVGLLRGGVVSLWQVEHAVGGRVPCVMDADDQQQQRYTAGGKQCGGVVVASGHERRDGERDVRDKRQYGVKQPVFEHRFVIVLSDDAPDHDRRIENSGNADHSPRDGDRADRLERHSHERRQEQRSRKLCDGRRGKGVSGLGAAIDLTVGQECHHDKLQPDKCPGRSANNKIKTVPFGQFFHTRVPILLQFRCGSRGRGRMLFLPEKVYYDLVKLFWFFHVEVMADVGDDGCF